MYFDPQLNSLNELNYTVYGYRNTDPFGPLTEVDTLANNTYSIKFEFLIETKEKMRVLLNKSVNINYN